MTINNNSVEQINVALLDMDKKLKSAISKSASASDFSNLEASVDNIKRTLNETKTGLEPGKTYDINISGNAATADKAKVANKLVNALTVNGITYDGSEAVDAGVQEIENGGTGVTTQEDINKAFVGALEEGTSDVTDGTEFVSSWASDDGFAYTNAVNTPYKRQFIKVWNYIKDKISSVLGLTSAKVSSYDSHLTNKDNPHSVTKSQVGLGSVVNTGDSATPVSGGTTKFTTGGAYTELNKKVDKVDGKGLSSNDFTDTYKDKLDKIDTAVTTDSSNLVTSGAVATAISTEVTNRNTAITNAINNLDVSSVGGDGKYISAISETNGKISATSTTMDTAPTTNSVKAVTSGGIKTAISTAETNAKNLANATGTLAIANGGTGVTTQADINKAFVSNLDVGIANVTDGTEFVSSYASDKGFSSTDEGSLHTPYKRQFIKVWNYIKDKISSVLGLTSSNYDGKAATAGTADKTVNDITINIPFVQESGQYVILLGNILQPGSPEASSPYNWDITGFFSIIRTAGHAGLHLNFEAGHGYSHGFTTYAYLDEENFTEAGPLGASIKAFQYNGEWWMGLWINTTWQGYTSKMTITYSRGLPATPTCILYNSSSGGVANEEIYNSIQDIPSWWWRRRTIYNPTTFTQNITAPVIQATTNFTGNLTGNVTGNVSGSSGKVANKLTINGQSFDGSSALDINIYGAYDHIVYDDASLLEWANCTDGSMKKVLVKSGTYNMTKGVDFSKAGTGYVFAENGAVINSKVPIAFTASSGKTTIHNLKVVCGPSSDNTCAFSASDIENLILYDCEAGYATNTITVNRNLFSRCTCYNCHYNFTYSSSNSSMSIKVFYQCYCYNCICKQTIAANSSSAVSFADRSYFYMECVCISCDAELTILRNIKAANPTFSCYYNCWDRCVGCLSKINVNSKASVYSTLYGFLRCQHMSSCKEVHTEGYSNIKGVVQCIYISSTSAVSGESNTNVGNSCSIA